MQLPDPLPVDPIVAAEDAVRRARETTAPEQHRAFVSAARANVERARGEIARLRREVGASPSIGVLRELGELARRLYHLEMAVSGLERGGLTETEQARAYHGCRPLGGSR